MKMLDLVLGFCGMVKKISCGIVPRVQVRSRLEEEGPVEAQYLGQPESFDCGHRGLADLICSSPGDLCIKCG